MKGDEVLAVGQERIPCYVVEVSRKLHYREGTIIGSSSLWIGKNRRWVYKEISMRGPTPLSKQQTRLAGMRRTVVMTKIEETPLPSASAFDIDAILRARPPSILPNEATVPPPSYPAVDSEARRLLAETSVNYMSMQSYRAEHVLTGEVRKPGEQRRIRDPVHVSYRRPGQWPLFDESQGTIWFQDLTKPDGFIEYRLDGNTWWTERWTQFLRPPYMLYEDLADTLLAARVLPNQKIAAGGETWNVR